VGKSQGFSRGEDVKNDTTKQSPIAWPLRSYPIFGLFLSEASFTFALDYAQITRDDLVLHVDFASLDRVRLVHLSMDGPVVLVPSAMGLGQPLLLDPDVIILDEAMIQDLEVTGIPDSLRSISWKPTILLGVLHDSNVERGMLQSPVTLPLASSSSEIMQMIQTLAQAEPAEGRQVPSPTHGQGFNLTLPVPAVS
jgi:hypothetical protein